MSEIERVLKAFVGYLKRPDLYPELGRKIVKNAVKRGNAFKGKDTTQIWLSKRAITQDEAIKKLFGIVPKKFSQLFPEALAESQKKESECPIKMGGAGALELIYYSCEFTKAESAIEMGVAYGWSSLAALLSLKKRNGALYSSDMPYFGL